MILDWILDWVVNWLFVGVIVVLVVIMGVLLAGAFGAFDGDGIQAGVIESKEYTAAQTMLVMMPAGKTVVPQTHYTPESWHLHIRNGDATGRIKVSKVIWDKFSVGEFFSLD